MSTAREKELQNTVLRLEEQVALLERENSRLRERARQADSASKAKSDFLAMISHEIRTPMNGVIGLSELLLETELGRRQEHFAELILSSARSLLTLINSLLDFSKIEADKMTLEIQPFDLGELLEEIIALYEVSGRHKGLAVTLDFDSSLDGRYLGDAYRIRQVLVNLLGNAIKFTDQGEIRLQVTAMEDTCSQTLRFTVMDSGIGIPEEQQGSLFVAFSQLDNSPTRQYGGTGLGLVICKKLVELMGGEIGFSSRPGKGSSFWFTLCLEPVPAAGEPGGKSASAGQPAEKREAGAAARVLVVDDDPTNRLVLEEIFARTNAEVTVAEQGRQAVELCREHIFDLVLMDCRMPEMDGFEATARIRKQARPGNEPMVILALTADATRATRNRCAEVGMDDYLIKPLDTLELQKILDARLPDFALSVLPGGKEPQEDSAAASAATAVNRDTLDRLRENVGDLGPVLAMFLDLLPRRLQEMEQAVEKDDFATAETVAHTLKGSCSQFGAEELAELCAQMEYMARERKAALIGQQFERISRCAARVSEILSEQLD